MKLLVLLTPADEKTMEAFRPHMVPEMEAVWALTSATSCASSHHSGTYSDR
jgi:hypothetical protein